MTAPTTSPVRPLQFLIDTAAAQGCEITITSEGLLALLDEASQTPLVIGGKILFRECDLDALIARNFHPAKPNSGAI